MKHYGSGQRRHGRQRPWRRRRGRAPDEEDNDNNDDESCGGSGDDDDDDDDDGWVKKHLGHRNRGAISALLRPLVAAANGADGEAAKSACAATGSSSAGAVGPRARSDARARDSGRRGGGGGSGDGYDNDNNDKINSTMPYLLQSSFHRASVRSLSSTASTPMMILLPPHIAAIHGVSHEKPAAKGLVDSREQRTFAEFEVDGDILGGYCRWEEEDCTGAAAKCCNVEHVTNKVKPVIGDSKAKMGQGGGCRGR